MLGDLFLSLDDVEPPQHRERVAALLQRGYDVIAIVHTATGRITQGDKCALTPLSDAALASASAETKRALIVRSGATATTAALPPGSNASSTGAAATAQLPPCHLRQLTRLHFVASDPVQASQLAAADAVVRSYDLVSITPKSEKVLHQACTSLDVDIISLELSQRLTLKLRSASLKAALRRGIYFEICYAPGLREPSARRNLFCNAQALVRATRGKNLLLSSSARLAFEVRSPLELLHVATLFGLTHMQAQDAISRAPSAVVERAATRLAGRGLAVPGGRAAAAAASAAEAAAIDIQMDNSQGEQPLSAAYAQQQQRQLAVGATSIAAATPGGDGGGRGGRKRSAAAVR